MVSAPAEFLHARIAALRTWRRGGQQAVHKPLLLLYAIGRLQQGSVRLLPFVEVDKDLRSLLNQFGPPRSAHHPEYPFYRLQNDGIWEVVSDAPLRSRESNSDPPRSELLTKGARGGFKTDLFAALKDEKDLAAELCRMLLKANFPEEQHPSITGEVGVSTVGTP